MCRVGNGCGLGGDCFEGECVCREGWKQAREFSFINIDADGNITTDYPCDLNIALSTTLYSILLLVVVYGATAYGLTAEKKSQRIRLIPFFLTSFLTAVFCALKLTDIDRSMTDDPLMAVLFAVAAFATMTSSLVLVTKYVMFQYNASKLHDPDFAKYVQNIQTGGLFFGVCLLTASCLLIATSLIGDDSRDVAKIVVRTSLLLYSLTAVYGPVTAFVVINSFRQMLKKFKTEEKFSATVAVLLRIRNLVIASGSSAFLVFFLGSVSETWLRLDKYFLPFATLLYLLFSLAILSTTLKLKKKKKKRLSLSFRQ